MRHMIFHRATDGAPVYHETDDLDGAVRLVEHLRNMENVTDARIYALHEVPIEYRPYYRVEVAAAPLLASPPAWPEPLPEPAAAVPDLPVAEEAVAEEASGYAPATPSASSRFGLFSRG